MGPLCVRGLGGRSGHVEIQIGGLSGIRLAIDPDLVHYLIKQRKPFGTQLRQVELLCWSLDCRVNFGFRPTVATIQKGVCKPIRGPSDDRPRTRAPIPSRPTPRVLERGQLRMDPERHICTWKSRPSP